MAKVTLNKTALKGERDKLTLYEQYLPSLDLKRQQFLFEIRKARKKLSDNQEAIHELEKQTADWIALLANKEIDPHNLVALDSIKMGEQNLLGVRLPVLEEVKISVNEYSMLARPIWIDALIDALHDMVELQVNLQIQEERLNRLQKALRTITQRVNLFDKVLIPETQQNIRNVQIALGDAERAGVVRSKIAKNKRQAGEF